jgi:23S rRNA pseudouridine1911/1915/1917 synthase
VSPPPRSTKRWLVGAADGHVVSDVLARLGADADAVVDGRVFVGRRRVRRADEAVHEGDVVEVAAPRAVLQEVPILASGGDLVAVDKPAGIPTVGDHAGAAHALVAIVARTLGVDPACVHPTSRLDRDVSGVVVLALTTAAAERLAAARAAGTYDRRYVAVAARAPVSDAGAWCDPIGRSPRSARVRVVNGRDPVPAMTRYAVCARAPGGAAVLAVTPVTGRTHQIRVHAAHAGAPLVGDPAYGGPGRVTLANGKVHEPGRVALHALRVVVPDSAGGTLVALAPVPDALKDMWSALGGEAAAWELAASWDFERT